MVPTKTPKKSSTRERPRRRRYRPWTWKAIGTSRPMNGAMREVLREGRHALVDRAAGRRGSRTGAGRRRGTPSCRAACRRGRRRPRADGYTVRIMMRPRRFTRSWNCSWKRACENDSAWRRMAALSKGRDDTSRRAAANAATERLLDEHAGHAVHHAFDRSSFGQRDDRPAARLGFDGHHAEVLDPGHQDGAAALVEIANLVVLEPACKLHRGRLPPPPDGAGGPLRAPCPTIVSAPPTCAQARMATSSRLYGTSAETTRKNGSGLRAGSGR